MATQTRGAIANHKSGEQQCRHPIPKAGRTFGIVSRVLV